jgi:NTE family protein
MVAFVLSGGANLGAVQAGMVAALYERGITPDLLVGTSAGALNAAFLADRACDAETAAELADIWDGVRRQDLFPVGPVGALLGLCGARDRLVSDRGIRRVAEEWLGAREVQDTAIPLHLVAADAISGEEVCLSEGPLVDAVLASTAIPGLLPPVAWEGRTLFDGGVANDAPISTAVGLGADTIYVLPTGHACALGAPPRGALAMALHAITLLIHRRLIEDIEAFRDSVRLVVLPPPCPLDVAPGDFSRARELVDRALDDCRRFFDGGGGDQPPIRMRMHDHRPVTGPAAGCSAPARVLRLLPGPSVPWTRIRSTSFRPWTLLRGRSPGP